MPDVVTVTATITDGAGDVRAVRSADFTARVDCCPQCGRRQLGLRSGIWACLRVACGWSDQ
jgi:ribosomal protein L37AE/L43A